MCNQIIKYFKYLFMFKFININSANVLSLLLHFEHFT